MKKHFVYRFINIYGNVMYVGETNNIDRRIREHLSCNPTRTSFRKRDLSKISRIEYITVNGSEYGKLIEGYYILKYRSPALKNKAIPSKRVKIKNPPSNWRIYKILRNLKATSNSKNYKLKILIIHLFFWLTLLYHIFK